MHALEDSIVAFLVNLFATLGYGGIVVAMAIESASIPLPSELIMPLAGFDVVQCAKPGQCAHTFTLFGVSVAGAVGGTLGSIVAYAVGAYGGRPLLERYGKYVLISRHDLDLADRWFRRYGDGTAFFSRLLPVVRTFISLPAGVARMPFAKFVAYSFVGSLIWSAILAYAGMKLGENWERVRAVMQRLDYPIAALIVALIALYVYRHTRRRAGA